MKLFDRLAAALEKETAERRERYFKTGFVNIIQLCVVVGTAALVAWFYLSQINYYFHWFYELDGKPGVYNLTKAGVKWDVHYGKPEKCGQIDCHLKTNYPAKHFEKQMVLPAREYPLLGYKKGEMIYLRANVKVPEEILKYDHLTLFTIYVWAKHYEVYVGEQLLDVGGKESLYVSIPKKYIPASGVIDLAIKIDPGDLPYQGLANRLDLYLGAKTSMDRAVHQSFEYKTVFYLWFLIPRMLIGLIFAVLFMAVYRHREIAIFVGYTFFSCMAIFLKTAFVPEWLQKLIQGEANYLVFDAFAQLFLLMFVHEYFRRTSKAFNYIIVSLFTTVAITSFLYLTNRAIQIAFLQTELIYIVRDAIRAGAIFYGSAIGAITTYYLYRTKKSTFRFYSCGFMTVFLLFSAAYFMSNLVNPDRVNLGSSELAFDLLLYVTISLIISAEFGIALTQRDFIKSAMGKYLDDRVVDQMIKKQNTIPLEDKELTVLFCDIRSFTSLSEILDQRDLAVLIQEFREISVTAVKQTGGYIDKFIGDGFMATWGAPIAIEDHEKAACLTVLEMRKKIAEFNDARAKQNLPRISVGYGIAAGRGLIGEVESSGKSEYSVFGNTVNVASRLQDQTKIAACDCVVSEELYQKLKDSAVFEDLGKVPVKGKNEDVQIYKFIGLFNEIGIFYSNNPVWDMEYIGNIEPGLVSNTSDNLKIYNYERFRKKRAA